MKAEIYIAPKIQTREMEQVMAELGWPGIVTQSTLA